MEQKEKYSASQKTNDYILYMIVTSYCKKSVCISPYWEKRLFLCYKALSNERQYELEEECIKRVEKEVLCKAPKAFWDSEVKTRLVPDRRHGATRILMKSRNYAFCIYMLPPVGKRKPSIECYIKNSYSCYSPAGQLQ